MTAHTMTLELYYSGAWHDLTAASEVYTDLTVTTSRHGWTTMIGRNPGSMAASLVNTAGRYNPVNPMSPLYGLVGRSTPMRVTVDGTLMWTGEAAEWHPSRALGDLRRCVVTGGGILRRKGIGTPPVLSAISSSTMALAPVAYVPLVDGRLAASMGSAVAGLPGWPIMGTITPAAVDGPPGDTRKTPEMVDTTTTAGQVVATIVPGSSTGGSWTVDCAVRMAKAEGEDLDGWSPISIRTTGGACDVYAVWMETPLTQTLYVYWTSTDGTIEIECTHTVDLFDGAWHHLRVEGSQAGGTATITAILDDVVVDTASDTATLGEITRVYISSVDDAVCGSASVGHLTLHAGTGIDSVYQAYLGHAGELSSTRWERLATEQGLTATALGDGLPMGSQPVATLLDTLDDVVKTDGGIACEATDGTLTLRCIDQLYHAAPVLTIDVDTDLVPPLDPTIGDRPARNDVTVKRRDGGSARYEVTDGPMGTADPPTGAGRWTTEIELNPSTDAVLLDYARWYAALGCDPSTQYATVTLDLDANPALDPSTLDIGTLIHLDGLPAIDDPRTPVLMVVGIADTCAPRRRTIALTCVSGTTYASVGEYGGTTTSRYDTAGSELTDAEDTTSTSWRITTTSGPIWSTTAPPYDLDVDGERVTVTAMVGAASPQTATVTRSVNGVVKAHDAGTPVCLYDPALYGL